MSPFARLGNIFFSPGEVFQDVRRSPRDWWLALLVSLIALTASGYVVQWRLGLGPKEFAVATVNMGLDAQGKTRKDLSDQEKQTLPAMERFWEGFYTFVPLIFLIGLPIGVFILAGLYRLTLLVIQGETTFFRVVSVVSYSYYVPNVVKAVLTSILAFLQTPGELDALTFIKNGGILSASPAAFVSAVEHPVLRATLSSFDLFGIWYLVLATIGLVAVSKKVKTGTALLIVVTPYLLSCLLTIVGSLSQAK
jgi:hypothetical protein